MSRSDRIFRRLLRLFPAEFRADFGEDMTETFRDHREAALKTGHIRSGLALWWQTIVGIVRTAPREHVAQLSIDVRYALRNLRRHPAFTIISVLALAIGIGANTAVFTIVDGVLLRSLPYDRPEELVAIFERVPGVPVVKFHFSAPDFEIVQGSTQSFSGMIAYRSGQFELSGVGEPEQIIATRVSPGAFDLLGVRPILGRSLTEEDDQARARVVVLNHGFWTRAFGKDPSVIGRTLVLDRQPYTVVGVMGDRFVFPPRGPELNGEPAALYLPISFSTNERQGFGNRYRNSVLARLKPGVTLAQARADLDAATRTLAERYPSFLQQMAQKLSLPVWPFMDEIVGQSRRMILVLTGAVAIILLIACADVANLMLTRAGSRQRELALRGALGASPARVVRQLVTEGFVLSALGGIAGLALAYWTLGVLRTLAGTTLPRAESIELDQRTLLFTLVLMLATPIVFGILPAIRTTLQSTFDALKEGGRADGTPRGRHRLLGSLVVAQIALALMLSVGAGLLLRSFAKLIGTNPGFRTEQVVTASVTLPSGRYQLGPDVVQFHQRLVEAARGIPGVTAAATGYDRPLRVTDRRVFSADSSARPVSGMSRTIAATWTSGSYFEALGIPLERGRYFTDADGRSQRVVILSHKLATQLWPGQDPIGRQIKWGVDSPENKNPWMTVVGVVGDVSQDVLGGDIIPQTYAPVAQDPFYRQVNVLIKTDRAPAGVIADLRRAVRQLDPQLPLVDAQTVTDVVSASVKPQRFSMTVVTFFAFVALGLAVIGIYGVLANVVSQQTHEIGVRMALGARSSQVVWPVMRRALLLAGTGIALGVLASLVLSRVLKGLLYEVSTTDGVTFGAAVLLLSLLALLAGLVPAWRATRVDPLVALRE
jgi:putative ABC transport system permease protein